jgi:hypothetical protein
VKRAELEHVLREKDYAFGAALIEEGIVSRETLVDRLAMLDDVDDLAVNRVRQWLAAIMTG